eukprot:jgi/Mesen1/10611/ME000088S10109
MTASWRKEEHARRAARRAQRRAQGTGGGGALQAQAIIDWTALPAWIVKSLAERVYDVRNPCDEGRYLDPATDACVYMCRPGFRYDAESKACVAVTCADGYALKDGRCEMLPGNCRDGYIYDAAADACIPVQGVADEPRRSWGQALFAWVVQKLVKSNDSCPVGFYYDPNSKACVPMCAPGYLYDVDLKRCVPLAVAQLRSK